MTGRHALAATNAAAALLSELSMRSIFIGSLCSRENLNGHSAGAVAGPTSCRFVIAVYGTAGLCLCLPFSMQPP